MATKNEHDQDDAQSDNDDTGEFATDDLDRTNTNGTATSRRRRRHSRKRKKREKYARTATLTILGAMCIGLIGVGVLVGVSYRGEEADYERYRQAMEARAASNDEWLTECRERGNLDWACERFDREHFEKAAKLDRFECHHVEDSTHECSYKLGSAEVFLTIPEPYKVNGHYLAPRRAASAVIVHSDLADDYYISLSEKGRIQIKEHDTATTVFVINPSTGSLIALDRPTPPAE